MKKRGLALILGLAAVMPVLVACGQNVQTLPSQCAYIIQNGFFDSRHVKAILLPGERKYFNNTFSRDVYCNARNFVVKPGSGDLTDPIQAKTAADKSTGDGTPVDVQLSAYFTVNENRQAMLDFLPFCEKYNCFSPKDISGNDTSNHSSARGWNNMLAENFPNAIHRAVQHAMLNFPPNIWNDTSTWPKVADAIQSDFAAQIALQTGSNTPFFCGQGSTPSKCDPVRFSIERIDPTDSAIRNTYNQQVQQQYQQQLAHEQAKTNTDLLNAAKQKYGPFADYFLGLQDTIDKCNQNANCTVILGNPNQIAVSKK